MVIFLIINKNIQNITSKKIKKELSFHNRTDPITQFPKESVDFKSIRFDDLSTKRVTITAIFVKPCYYSKKTEKNGGCAFGKNDVPTLDVRFKLKAPFRIQNLKSKNLRDMGFPRLSQCAIVDQFGLRNSCMPYPLGDYSKPCSSKISEKSKLKCPIKPGNDEHRLMVQLQLPTYVPKLGLNSNWTLQGERGYRRVMMKFGIPLEIIGK